MKTIKRLFAFGCFAILAASVNPVSAQDYGYGYGQHSGYHSGYQARQTYVAQYKTVYVTRQVAYQVKVCKYRPCGTPYYVWETRYKTIRVSSRVRVY
jgi:hypothetical protein